MIIHLVMKNRNYLAVKYLPHCLQKMEKKEKKNKLKMKMI